MQDSPLASTNQKKTKPDTKGFRVMVDDTHIGFLNITENKVDPAIVQSLQKVSVMKAILDKATLEPYNSADRDMSGIAGIIAAASAPSVEDAIKSELDKEDVDASS